MQIKKKKLFLFELQICGSSSACRKKTRCRRMAPVPPFWDICQWQNFLGNLNTWPNTSRKRFVLLPFLQPKKNVQTSLHWCCSLTRQTLPGTVGLQNFTQYNISIPDLVFSVKVVIYNSLELNELVNHHKSTLKKCTIHQKNLTNY